MTPERLRDLIARGESLSVEFKRAASSRELVETVVCLANRPGREPAWLLLGVEDDGTVVGLNTGPDGEPLVPRTARTAEAPLTPPAAPPPPGSSPASAGSWPG